MHHAPVSFKDIIIGFAIEFNNVIPLALYISLEIVKIGQMLLVQGDIDMYDETSDTPMRCNTNTILENLGQVNFLLSDKTGTLTKNIMTFRKISLAGTIFEHERITSRDSCPDTSSQDLRLDSGDDQNQFNHADLQSANNNASTIRHREATASSSHLQHCLTIADLVRYTQRRQTQKISNDARNFVLGMALCNTCVPELQDGFVNYQASSPDEVALIQAAQELGYQMTTRTSDAIALRVNEPVCDIREEWYEILDVFEFSSRRKRMSIIIKCPDGRIWLICKGADSVILRRLRQASLAAQAAANLRKSLEIERLHRSEQHDVRSSAAGASNLATRTNGEAIRKRSALDLHAVTPNSHILGSPASMEEAIDSVNQSIANTLATFTTCFRHIDEFATEGLRTLVFAHKYIPDADYIAWKKIYRQAFTSFSDRQGSIERAAEEIEQSLDLLGASAIEDRLQEGVPDTIDKLHRANIKIWMLTGDKRETAINVAHASRICQLDSDIFVLDAKDGDLHGQMRAVAEAIAIERTHCVVVVDGHTLTSMEDDVALKTAFYSLIPTVSSVICCRASPAQKAAIVKAIKA